MPSSLEVIANNWGCGVGVGMPESVQLDEFGSHLWFAFGHQPYLVGSVLKGKTGWRDVDVRVMLPDEEWDAMELGEPTSNGNRRNGKWVALCLAFSELGKAMTGLRIDFQLQRLTEANEEFGELPRSAIGLVPLRWV